MGGIRLADAGFMLHWSLVSLIVAVVIALIGFGGVSGAASSVANVAFGGFLVLAATTLATRGRGAA